MKTYNESKNNKPYKQLHKKDRYKLLVGDGFCNVTCGMLLVKRVCVVAVVSGVI